MAIGNSDIQDKAGTYQTYLSAVSGKSNSTARSIAADILGEQVYWDWDGNFFRYRLMKQTYSYSIAPRTREGYYHYTGGVEVKFPLFTVEVDLKTFYPRQL